jgi:hypothetical protein
MTGRPRVDWDVDLEHSIHDLGGGDLKVLQTKRDICTIEQEGLPSSMVSSPKKLGRPSVFRRISTVFQEEGISVAPPFYGDAVARSRRGESVEER